MLAMLVVAVPAGVLAQAQCQPGTDTTDAALAARYAPVLRFAPGEPYFPTLPFFYAFDGIDNNNNGRVDFDDLDEIAAFNPGDTLSPSWSILDDWYNAELVRQSPAGGTPVAPVPAVFWHVIDMTPEQQDVMSRFLKKDILAWNAASRTEIGTTDLLDEPFKVIEYYFYYVRDKGLVGHPQDIEFTFVFVPADPTLACIARIVAGAGHTDWVPNNILVLSNELALSPLNATPIDTLTGILTELGGHSSSPDAPPYGKFRLGVDVNWQSTKAWGVRDVQAIAHMGYGGVYQQEMTLPRDTVDHPVFYWPRGSEHGYGQDYSLVPASLFERLYARLDSVADGVKPGQWPATLEEIRRLLDSIAIVMHATPYDGVATLDSAAVLRMATWNLPMIAPGMPGGGKVSPNRGQVWKHSAYHDWPTEVFETHLYAPSVKSIEKPVDLLRLVTWGISEWPGNGAQIQVGMVLPWIYLPIVPRGFLTFDVGFIASDEWTTGGVSLNLSYISSYFQRVSWYTTFAYIFNDDVTGSHFTVSVGPSLLLWRNTHQRLLSPLNTLRLSTGPRFRLSGPSSAAGVDWEFKFTFRQ
jgi:hypothetical protein